jgi:hypothetical protein
MVNFITINGENKMKKSIAILILLAMFSGCYYSDDQDIDISFNSFDDMAAWITENIEYKKDILDEWQTPEQTYAKRTGDCEDFAFLASYWLREMKISHALIVSQLVENPTKYHMSIILTDYNMWYMPVVHLIYNEEMFDNNYIYLFTLKEFSY